MGASFSGGLIPLMRLNCFIDETGQDDMSSDVYLITLVFHDHSKSLNDAIAAYEARLTEGALADIPFHMVDLLHGHGAYEGLSPEKRKPMLYAFATFVRMLPISYATFCFDARETRGRNGLESRIRKSVSDFIFSHLEKFQTYDEVAVYYDGGSAVVGKAVRAAFDFALARDVASYRRPIYSERRLLQAADYLTSIELAAIRYDRKQQSKTYERFFGTRNNLKRNLVKPARRLKRT